MPVIYIENIINMLKKLNVSMLSPFFAVIHKKVYSKQSLFKTYVIIRYAFIAMLSRQKSAKICRHTLLFPKPIISCLAWLVIWLAIIIRSLITVRKRLCLTALSSVLAHVCLQCLAQSYGVCCRL